MKTFGSDPEFMVTDDHGFLHSAIGIVHGDIDNKVKHNGHEFYYDNVLAECAIKPSKTARETIKNFRECLKFYSEMVQPYRLTTWASAHFHPDQLQCDCVDEHYLCAKHAGCNPDWDAYSMVQVDAPSGEIENGTFRTCGGHIHLGGDQPSLNGGHEQYQLLYLLDLLLGVPSIFLDTAADRRNLYGQAGRFRDKDYGVEYRSLSNFWLSSPKLVNLVWEICHFACHFVDSGQAERYFSFDIDKWFETQDGLKCWTFHMYDRDEIQDCINRSDVDKAQKFFEIGQQILSPKVATELRAVCKKPLPDLYKSWKL